MKGDATCHTYSSKGRVNHDKISWESSNGGRCKHKVLRGKLSVLCNLGYSDCPQKGSEPVMCPIKRYEPEGLEMTPVETSRKSTN